MKIDILRIFSIAIIFTLFSTFALAVETRMSVTDKELLERLHSLDVRIARLEEGQKGLSKQIDGLDKRIDGLDKRIGGLDERIGGLDKRIDGLSNMILGGFAVVFAGIFSLIGFVIWDRRTAISPVISKTKELEEREDLTLKILKEYARKEPKLAEILKSLGLF